MLSTATIDTLLDADALGSDGIAIGVTGRTCLDCATDQPAAPTADIAISSQRTPTAAAADF